MITVGITKLFLIDNDKEMLDLVIEGLHKNNIVNYKEFHDVDAALESIGYDMNVILLDHYLNNGRTGVEVTIELKKRNRNNFIIGFSAVEDPKILKKYINSDIDRWIDKSLIDSQRGMMIVNAQIVEYVTEGVVTIREKKEQINQLKQFIL